MLDGRSMTDEMRLDVPATMDGCAALSSSQKQYRMAAMRSQRDYTLLRRYDGVNQYCIRTGGGRGKGDIGQW